MTSNIKHKIKSFEEVKMINQQDRVNHLEMQLEEMYCIAEDNFELIQKILNFDHALMQCKTPRQVFKVVQQHLAIQFKLPEHVLKLALDDVSHRKVPETFLIKDVTLRKLLQQQTKITTGTKCIHPKLYDWFGPEVTLESFLHLPLFNGSQAFGLLLIGHENPEYFSENVPTDYVEILAKSISITLARMLGKQVKI